MVSGRPRCFTNHLNPRICWRRSGAPLPRARRRTVWLFDAAGARPGLRPGALPVVFGTTESGAAGGEGVEEALKVVGVEHGGGGARVAVCRGFAQGKGV